MANRGICRLCRTEGELRKSHIIPEWAYRPVCDDDGAMLTVTNATGRFGAIRHTGEYDPSILCAACESRSQPYDDYSKRVLLDFDRAQAIAGANKTNDRWVCLPVDYARMKLFFLWLLWRIGASSRPGFEGVRLGDHLEAVGRMLLGDDPGSADDYGVLSARFEGAHRLIPGFDPTLIIANPHLHRFEEIRCVRAQFCGFVFWIKVDQRPWGHPARRAQLSNEGNFFVILRDFTGSQESRMIHRVCLEDTRAAKSGVRPSNRA